MTLTSQAECVCSRAVPLVSVPGTKEVEVASSNVALEEQWRGLADAAEEERREKMEVRYLELAALPEEERREQLKTMARVEYTLPDDKIRPFHLSRLRVWLKLESETVRAVASSYEAIMNELPGEIAMRRVSVVQTLARGFDPADQERLREIVPRVFAESTPLTINRAAEETRRVLEQAPSPKKPWWAFWRK
jgi:hypothetical protein